MEFILLDGSLAQVRRLIAENPTLSVQMAVFEISSAIGSPAYLKDSNKKLLQDMGAYR